VSSCADARAEGHARRWVPAFAGMTVGSWVPAFAGMTVGSWVPAFAGMMLERSAQLQCDGSGGNTGLKSGYGGVA